MSVARRGALVMVACISAAGCAPPDHWSVFDVDWHDKIEGADELLAEDEIAPLAVDPPASATLQFGDIDGPIELPIERAVLMALANNRDLAVIELNPTIIGAFELFERGVYDPELFADFTYSEAETSQTTDITGEQFTTRSFDNTADVGIRQRLPTGTDIELSAGQARSASNRRPEQREVRAGLTVTQALLRGFGPAVNLASVRQAELDTLASLYELRGFTEELIAQTEIAYWSYVLAEQEIAIFERALEVAAQQRDNIEDRINVGVLPRTEAAAARAEVALRQQALIDARSAREAQRLLLIRLINPSTAGTLDVSVNATSSSDVEAQPITDAADRITLAQQMRPDLNEARLRLEQNRLQTIVTRNGLLPRLDLFIALGKTGFGPSLSEAIDEAPGSDTYDATVGLNFSYLIGNRAAEGRHLAARATRLQAAEAVRNLQQLIRFDVEIALNEVERARQQIEASAVTRALQEETVRAEEERFAVGSSTTLLVAQAQRDLLIAQIAEVEAVIAYRIALVNLYLAEGSLLERRGITMAESMRERREALTDPAGE